MGCEVDVSPAKVRVNFKEHACGAVASCRKTELPMEPRLCFDFCRTQETAKFFGIRHGRECYCTTYFEPKSTGGQGICNSHCEGDQKEMCGGPEKSSLFEMHMCGDSGDEADMALQMGSEAATAAASAAEAAGAAAKELVALASAWQLGVCSVAPEGQRVCALTMGWLAAAAELGQGSADANHSVNVLNAKTDEVASLKAEAASSVGGANATLMSGLELATDSARTLAGKAKGEATAVNMTLARVAGPIGVRSLAAFDSVFQPLGDVKANWHAVCALEAIAGEAYGAVAEDDPATCADRCLSLSTGLKACVAFNYQYKDGLAACQLLHEGGLAEPQDRIAKAVPVFEVSGTKKDAIGLTSLGCYAKKGFLAGHPKGPLSTYVVKEVTI